ncbi:Beige/BEACH domain containing protein [Trichomonas vaginalis G3]|uniref:Beige/BEACH domain containing protein n=1 Tax=Trichomonas vaginalis (strain ATCC PRA-98 / G3) TaxID=412133 RepID=A2G275_TRIV3|nr:aggrephagy protein [Trichomonas vaginalis G3]EAX88740.1 Beige/BEACH domain containing protein [Trichomonas vaginalis G3]KAI5536960.1 aggrephagy protein [Trichomonas vaginalis G3]|eukprot:XP_001301670.1 Beige/BEACH domain containing protein [Trichomonas vaginalis G3]
MTQKIHEMWTKGYIQSLLSAKKYFIKLQTQLLYKGSPFIQQNLMSKTYFKRGNYFDFMFRPIVLLPNNHYVNHDDAAILRGTIPAERKREPVKNTPQIENTFSNAANEINVLWESQCTKIKLTGESSGNFYVCSSELRFVSITQITTRILGKDVKDVFWCFLDQKPNSIQIFTYTNKNYLFKFFDEENHKFVSNLKKCEFPNIRFFQENSPQIEINKLHLTKDWQERKISTMEYLIWLNLLSGRSFNSTKCYPVFPFIAIKDKSNFDIENTKIYRDLSLNLGVINKECLENLKIQSEAQSMEFGQNFLHPSYISNPFSVTYFMVRQEPFTTLHIKYQDGAFDASSRIFKSIPYLFSKVDSPVGFNRELTPEFFFSDEFLRNENDFNFGQKEDGTEINDVDIPKWSETVIEFTNKMHRMLESSYSSKTINKWIDMIWGINQQGENAVKTNNTYSPLIYPNFKQDFPQETISAALNTIGQIPQQLFTSFHPQRPANTNQSDKGTLVISQLPSSVVAFRCVGATIQTIRMLGVLKTGKIVLIKTSANNIPVNVISDDRTLLIPNETKLVAFVEGVQPNFYFVSPRSNCPSYFEFKSSQITKAISKTPHLDEINCIGCARNYIVCGGKDACLSLWTSNNLFLLNTLIAHQLPIVCLAVSSFYGIVVSVSQNRIVICGIHNLAFIRMIDLDLPKDVEPEKIFITENMGYIILVAGKIIRSYTINLRVCSEKRFDLFIKAACPFTTLDFDDRVAIVTEDNTVEFLDAYSLVFIKQLCRPKETITHIEFSQDSRYLISATDANLVYFLPID